MTPFPQKRTAASLMELLVAMTILLILMGIILGVTHQTGQLWRGTNSKIASFQDARAAFDALSRNLSQATLNHYYDYYDKSWKRRTDADTDFVPANYGRSSDLHFLCGPADVLLTSPALGAKQSHAVFFQAPIGRVDDKTAYASANSLVNTIGYYVEFSVNTNATDRPKFLRDVQAMKQARFRLMEWIEPSEKLRLYDASLNAADPKAWLTAVASADTQCRVIAENILALIILPEAQPGDTTLAPAYSYDSAPTVYDSTRSHLLPPLLKVTLVAIDRDSAARLNQRYGDTMPPLYPQNAFKSAAAYESDLAQLEQTLQGKTGLPKISYRIFTTTINTRDNR
ncbi:MAG: Verru_Chthon cassette protein C [Chthoniobacteraceae bacterium]